MEGGQRKLVEALPVQNSSSTPSNTKTLPTSPLHSTLQRDSKDTNSHSVPNCSSLSSSTAIGIYNNYLLQQDPQTGRVTLFPVQIAVSQPITGLDLSMPFNAGSETDRKEECDTSHVLQNGESEHNTTHSCHKKRSNNVPNNSTHPNSTEPHQQTQVTYSASQRRIVLQQVIGLIREEFAFDGYLENGVEELAMGNCCVISITFSTVHRNWELASSMIFSSSLVQPMAI